MNIYIKKLVNKLKFLKGIILNFFIDIKYFSYKLSFLRFFESILNLLMIRKVARKLTAKKNNYILNYLKTKYGHIFDDLKNNNSNFINYEDINIAPIWVCWFDGIENAPMLVQQCYKSIEKNANGHPVNLITLNNYFKYVDIPAYIIKKFNNRKILPAHFSDILRVSLLAKYGGLWLDATIYCSKPIPIEYFEYDFFTCKSDTQDIACVSKMRWTTFCLGSKPNNNLFLALEKFFFEYWRNENYAIDYLFFDDAIEIARKLMPEVQKMLNEVKINNIKRDDLISRFANPWFTNCCDDLLNSDTVLFKLGYREAVYLNKYTVEGKETVYNAFLNNFYK